MKALFRYALADEPEGSWPAPLPNYVAIHGSEVEIVASHAHGGWFAITSPLLPDWQGVAFADELYPRPAAEDGPEAEQAA
jgi:hypothetical protein